MKSVENDIILTFHWTKAVYLKIKEVLRFCSSGKDNATCNQLIQSTLTFGKIDLQLWGSKDFAEIVWSVKSSSRIFFLIFDDGNCIFNRIFFKTETRMFIPYWKNICTLSRLFCSRQNVGVTDRTFILLLSVAYASTSMKFCISNRQIWRQNELIAHSYLTNHIRT